MEAGIDRIDVQYQLSSGMYGVWLAATIDGKRHVAQSLHFEPVVEGSYVPPPIHLQPEEAQLLSNALWDAGIRPQQSRQSQGQAEAMAHHLSDMREIAFHKLGIKSA